MIFNSNADKRKRRLSLSDDCFIGNAHERKRWQADRHAAVPHLADSETTVTSSTNWTVGWARQMRLK